MSERHAKVLDPREVRPLDGTWEIAFDPGNQGREAGWHDPGAYADLPESRPITVPSCWEEIERDYEGVAYYHAAFQVPEAWMDKRVYLQFGAVNYLAEVWLNGTALGCHEGGYGPFSFRVDDVLAPAGDNVLRVRVLGPLIARNQVIDGIGKDDMPHWRGAIAGGIWQSVCLVATGHTVIEDVFVVPHLDPGQADVRVDLDHTGMQQCDLSVAVEIASVDEPARPVAACSETRCLQPGRNHGAWTLTIPDVRAWSPNHPHRYLARITVSGPHGTEDAYEVTFGMRELTIRDNRLELNRTPVYLKAAFFEGLYPTRLANPDDEDMARRELQLAKDAGFNMIRPWRKPPPPRWLDLCDEMGLMVVGGMPIECMKRWPTVTPHLSRRIENEIRSAILRDRNRACIVQWELFNEIWRIELERLKHPMSMLARDLDPSRLILDESGGFAGGSNIYLPHRREPDTFNDVHRYPGAPFSGTAYDQILAIAGTTTVAEGAEENPGKTQRENIIPDRLTIVSEIGYGSLPDLVDNNQQFRENGNAKVPPYRYHRQLEDSYRAVLQTTGLDAIYPDLQAFCREQQGQHGHANQRMIEAIRSNPRIQGYAVHALTDGDWILGAGLIDLFRNPKEVYRHTRAANQPVILAVRPRPRNVYATHGMRITVTGVNDEHERSATLRLKILNAQGGSVWEHAEPVNLGNGVSALLDQPVETNHGSGTYTLLGVLEDEGGKAITSHNVEFDVFGDDALVVPPGPVTVMDPASILTPFLGQRGIPFHHFDHRAPRERPVMVTLPRENTSDHLAQFHALHAFVDQGGTAVFLEAVHRSPQDPYWAAELPAAGILPVPARLQHAMGLWVCVSHIVREHPVFEGLPVNGIMGQVYENVWTPHTLCDVPGEIIAASVSHNYHQKDTANQHYLGPEDAWAGMDVGVVPSGNGRYVLSALRLLENLGSDPVADKILYNLVRWSAS